MEINLKKGRVVSLRKKEIDPSRVTIGLGWDIGEVERGFLGRVDAVATASPMDAFVEIPKQHW